MNEQSDPQDTCRYRKYELPLLATVGLVLTTLAANVPPINKYLSASAFLALLMFLYLSRYILDPIERRKSSVAVIGALIGLSLATAAQVLYIQDIVAKSPAAAFINTCLMGILISTILFLYILGRGLDVIDNYARRFNKKYRERVTPKWIYALLLIAYGASAGKYVFMLFLVKGLQ